MAKYKVGDKVKVGGHTATIVKIIGTSASGEQMYGVKQDDNGWAYESLEGKMKAAANAKFKVGQKVARVSDGKVGVIQEAYADGTYAVHVDGEANPNKMPENRIRAVNSSIKSTNPIVSNAIKACNEYHEYIPKGWKRDSNYGNFKKGDYVLLERKIYKIVDDFKYSDEVPVQPLHGGKTEIRDLLHAVRIVKNAFTIASNSEVEITLRYASRAQSAMRDAVRAVSGAKISSTNTIECRSRDDAEEVVDILKMNAGIPDGEVWINSRPGKKVATNADGNPESLANWKRIFPKLREFNNLAGWLKGEGSKLMNVARNFDDKKFHSIGYDIQSVCEWSERKSAEILKQA